MAMAPTKLLMREFSPLSIWASPFITLAGSAILPACLSACLLPSPLPRLC